MRTTTDLIAACELLADDAEGYAAERAGDHRPVDDTDPSGWDELSAPATGSTHRRRRLLPALAVAAVIALAIGVIALVGTPGQHRGGPAGGAPGAARVLGLGVRPGSSVRLVGAGLGLGSPTADLRGPGGVYNVTIYPRGERPRIDFAHAQGVTIHGHPGYLECFRLVPGTSKCDDPLLGYQPKPGQWLLLGMHDTGGKPAPWRHDLRTVAAAIEPDAHTRLRSPITIPQAPKGTTLHNWAVGYPGDSASGPSIDATYANLDRGKDWYVQIDAYSHGPSSHQHGDAKAVTVDGRPGVWDAARHRLWYRASQHAWLLITTIHIPAFSTLHQIGGLAARIRVASNLNDPKTWPYADTALPTR